MTTFQYDRTKYGRCEVCGAPDDHPSYQDPYAHVHAGHPRSVFNRTVINEATGLPYVKRGAEAAEADRLCCTEPPDATAIPKGYSTE